jgi:hypothetical protein
VDFWVTRPTTNKASVPIASVPPRSRASRGTCLPPFSFTATFGANELYKRVGRFCMSPRSRRSPYVLVTVPQLLRATLLEPCAQGAFLDRHDTAVRQPDKAPSVPARWPHIRCAQIITRHHASTYMTPSGAAVAPPDFPAWQHMRQPKSH